MLWANSVTAYVRKEPFWNIWGKKVTQGLAGLLPLGKKEKKKTSPLTRIALDNKMDGL